MWRYTYATRALHVCYACKRTLYGARHVSFYVNGLARNTSILFKIDDF